MDLTATFLAAAEAKLPSEYKPDGINLLPILTKEKPEQDRTLFWRIDRSNRKQWAVRSGKWKFIDDGHTMDLLFDLENDIGERHDVNYKHMDIVHDLKAKLKAWEAEMDASEREFIVR